MAKTTVTAKVEKIKAQIQELPARQRIGLARWLAKVEEDGWDKQIARDATKGKLKNLLDQVDDDIDDGKLYALP